MKRNIVLIKHSELINNLLTVFLVKKITSKLNFSPMDLLKLLSLSMEISLHINLESINTFLDKP